MIIPKFIKKESVIGVVAPSDGADNELKLKRFKNACSKLESLGYKIKLSDNVFNSFMGRSASEKQRAKEFNEMVSDKNVDLIMCASGGEFLLEILPYIDFELLKNNPKFVCGFSDPTGLLYPITTKCDIATIYGKNFSHFGMEEYHKSEEDFLKIINGIDVVQDSYEKYEGTYLDKVTGLESYNLDSDVKWMTVKDEDIFIRGRIIGGCFDIISDLAGTKYDGINEFNEKYKSDGIIWYFDNCEKSMDDVIRILWKFNELGYFKYAEGIIFGRFGKEVSNTYENLIDCLKDSVISKLDIPIIYNADVSHKGPCLNIINGVIAEVEVKNNKGKVKFRISE